MQGTTKRHFNRNAETILNANESCFDKTKLIKDILYQIDYQQALRKQMSKLSEAKMIEALSVVPISRLLSWYFAWLEERVCLQDGYETHNLTIECQPNDSFKDLLKAHPEFNIEQWLL